MSILIRKENSNIITFDNIDDLCNYLEYNNIVWLKIENITFNRNFYFPIKLQQLFINNCDNCNTYLNKLPSDIIFVKITNCRLNNTKKLINNNASNLETLDLSYNRLTSIPLLPNKLISLNLAYNDIAKLSEINYFSEEIQYINLSYNKLDNLPECILNLNNNCNLVLMPNYFWFNSYSNISLNKEIKDYHIAIANRFFDSSLANKLSNTRNIMNNMIGRDVEHNYANYDVRNNIINNVKNDAIKVKTTAEQAQNVHNSDIQDSFSKSVTTIMNHGFPKIVNYLEKIWYYYIVDGIDIIQNAIFINCINRNCKLKTIVSKSGVTYGEIMERIWTISQNHDSKIEIRKILRDEINAGKHLCFTGQVTRLVNSLSGFVDGVQIGYSENEQINNAVIATMRRCEKDNLLIVLDEVKKILDVLEVPEDKQQIWLDALE
jgi:hypothetical protein